MFPFSTTSGLIFDACESMKISLKDVGCGFSVEKNKDHYKIMKLFDTMNSNYCNDGTEQHSMRQSTSHLPISTRNDRFQDRNAYSKMYFFNGLIDRKHYQSIKRILKSVNDWDFNIFSLERFTSGCPLTYLSIDVFEMHNLYNEFSLDVSKLYQFFMVIERSYHQSNPYHNALHAADVTQAINCIIQDECVFKNLTPTDILCSLLSTICHDVDHPGLNNVYLNNSNHHLSILYKKESVLENHHWAFSLSVLMETGIFSHFSPELWKKVTQTCGSLIRATDISKQNFYISNFNTQLFSDDQPHHSPPEDEKLLVLQMAIKCADICNPCRRWDICNCWAYLVTEEFFQQGDREKMLSLPLSPIMDREKCKLPAIQRDFIRFLVYPLFRAWDNYVRSELSQRFLTSIDANQAGWQRLADLPVAEENGSSCDGGTALDDRQQHLIDRLQLMQVMDYSHGHQLLHLKRLQLDLATIPATALDDGAISGISGGDYSMADVMLPNVVESIDDNEDVNNNDEVDGDDLVPRDSLLQQQQQQHQLPSYHSNRRGSLPTTFHAGQVAAVPRETLYSRKPVSVATNRQKMMSTRRTSLQMGPGFTTSFISSVGPTGTRAPRNSVVAANAGNSATAMKQLLLAAAAAAASVSCQEHVRPGGACFPTSCRRGSAPAIRVVAMDTTSTVGMQHHQVAMATGSKPYRRRASVTGAALSCYMCSSQSHLNQHHAHSLSDIQQQIPQVG